MQAAGHRTSKRLSRAAGGASDKQQRESSQDGQPATRKQKRKASDLPSAPAAKKRRSAPELPKAGAEANTTPVTTRSAYNLRTRNSMPAAGNRGTDGSLPVSSLNGRMPSSVRPRNPNQKATWSDLPAGVLKLIVQNLDPATVFVVRSVAVALREACSCACLPLRFTLPMQSSPWMPVQLEAWERRINGVVGQLTNGAFSSREVQLRMEGAEAWEGDECISPCQISATIQRLLPLLNSLRKLGNHSTSTITRLDAELPLTPEILGALDSAFPRITSLRLDCIIPPPHNHVHLLAESHCFAGVRELDIRLTAWDQLQHLAVLCQLTKLHVRYCMWNIPELSPLVSLVRLETFSIEVLDDRARFQLDFLGPLVRGAPRLKHLRAAVILSRTVVSEGGPASCDFLLGCGLETLALDVRVPQDAARTAHTHFRNLHLAPQGCKITLTIRADFLTRETSFESAATRVNAITTMPRVGVAQPDPPEARERWGALSLSELGGHPSDALALVHLRGYRTPISMLPDLSAARLTRLQISNARLSPADITTLAGCSTLEHLHVRFAFQAEDDPTAAAASAATSASGSGATTLHHFMSDFLMPRDLNSALGARSTRSAPLTIVTRSRKSLIGSGAPVPQRGCGAGGGGWGAAAALALQQQQRQQQHQRGDCSTEAAHYVLRPLLQLRKLRSLELLEEGGVTNGSVGAGEPGGGEGGTSRLGSMTGTGNSGGGAESGGAEGPHANGGTEGGGGAGPSSEDDGSGPGGAATGEGGGGDEPAAAAVAMQVDPQPSAAAVPKLRCIPRRKSNQKDAAPPPAPPTGSAGTAAPTAPSSATTITAPLQQQTQEQRNLTAGTPATAPHRPPHMGVPFSRSGLTHFLHHLAAMPQLTALSLSLLTEEAALPDCPCAVSCFAAPLGPSSAAAAAQGGSSGGGPSGSGNEAMAVQLRRPVPPAPLVEERLVEILGGRLRMYKVVLGGVVVKCRDWYRPTAWPVLN